MVRSPAHISAGNPRSRRRRRAQGSQGEIVIKGARANNLKDFDVKIPLAAWSPSPA
jgi:excinuclease UvrABC ATPase subunit